MLSELKYPIFFGFLLTFIPFSVVATMVRKEYSRVLFFLAMFFSCRLNETINFVSHEFYKGTSRGFEVTLVDVTALSIFFTLPFIKKSKDIMLFPPGTILYGLYFLFSVVSILNSSNSLVSFFEVWKLARMYFFYWVLVNLLDENLLSKDFLKNLKYMLAYIFLVVLFDKYWNGVYQAKGPFPHQNSLVMYVNFFGSICFSHFLNSKKNTKIWGFFSAASLVLTILTFSRAGLVFYLLTLGIIFTLSVITRFNFKKVKLTFFALILSVPIVIKSMDSIVTRVSTAPKESAETRVFLAKAAVKMANENFFGVGLNNFGLKINKPYSYCSHCPSYHKKDNKDGLVETTYLMIAAETGWLNLLVFLCLLFRFYFKNLFFWYHNKDKEISLISLGLIGSLTTVIVHSCFEWVLRQTPNSYQLMIVFAVIARLAFKKKEEVGVENTSL